MPYINLSIATKNKLLHCPDKLLKMIIKSPRQIDIPITDVASFVFSSGTTTSRETPQYFDAANPTKNFSLAQAEGYVKQIASGLEALGLKPNDKVLLYSNNSLFFPLLLWAVLAGRFVFTAASPSASVTGTL
jgi:acyl-CoA synthetase (AMP-forming)/AMP-acid ligase II